MISAALRLSLIVGVLWWIARQWPVTETWFGAALEGIAAFLGWSPALSAFVGFTLLLTAARLLLVPLLIGRVRLDARRALFRHPFPRQSLRIQLRFRASRFLAVVLLDAWLLIAAWKTLQSLPITARVVELPGLGFGDWLDAAAAIAIVQIAAWLVFMGVHWTARRMETFGAAQVGFHRYQLEEQPVERFFTRYILWVQLPYLAVFAAVAPHSLAPLLAIASVTGFGIASVIAAALTRGLERRRDRWLERVRTGVEQAPGPTPGRELIARTIAFLHPGHPVVADLAVGTSLVPNIASPPPPSETSAPDYRAENSFRSRDEYRDSGTDNPGADNPGVHADSGTEPVSRFAFEAQSGEYDTIEDPPRSAGRAHYDVAGEDDGAAHYDAPSEQSVSVARESLNRARGLIDARRMRAARAALYEAISTGDTAEQLEAQALLKAAGDGFPWRYAFAGTMLLSMALLVLVGWQWLELPSNDETRVLARSAHVHVRKVTTGGNARLQLLGNRYDYSLNTRLKNISPHFINAVIASEDHRFYTHEPQYMVAKFVQAGLYCVARKLNVFSSATGCAGNSTITQQLARNLFLSESRSIVRKLKELLWAIKMELGMEKEEILEFYLNRLYLGRGNFGVELGARDYFNKSASRLSMYEAAFLAAAIKRPGWNWRQDKAGAVKRATLIVALMRKHGYAPASASFPARFKPKFGTRPPSKPYLGHLWQWIRPQVRSALDGLPDGDYKVVTSLDAELEIYTERHLQAEVARLGRPGTQAAAVVMGTDGRVLAMVGGVGDNVKARGSNRAKRTAGLLPRPPASSFKPFIYLAALESGLSPGSMISAAPVSINVPGDPRPYEPQNHDGKTYGDVSMRDGLVRSINTAAVRLLHDELGFEPVFDTLGRLGLRTDELPRQWGLALGSAGVPLVEMTRAYAILANGGRQVEPTGFTAISNERGRIVWRKSDGRERTLFRRNDVDALTSMLREVVAHGTGYRAADKIPPAIRVAGKTGTGDNFVDAWFIGFTDSIVIGIWVGNDTPKPMPGVYGGTAPARAFNAILHDLIDHTQLIAKPSARR